MKRGKYRKIQPKQIEKRANALAGGKVLQTEDGDLVVTIDAVVITLVDEGKGKDT